MEQRLARWRATACTSAARDSAVYALDAVTGAPAWKRELGQRVTTGFAVIGRSICFATADSVIHRLDTRTGATVRDLMAGEMLAQRPAVLGDSLIYFRRLPVADLRRS